MKEKIKKELQKKHYALAGSTSGVQICNWTKSALRGGSGCWKQKFYGIDSSRCCEMSPAVMWCENSCIHCWRPIEMNLGMKLPKIDDPKEIIDKIIEARKKLLIGFGGNKKVNKKKLREALNPGLFTFSLSGEATLYPRLGEMISELRKRKIITFLVTNGQNPEALKKLEKEKALPTQLTVSTNAPNKNLFDFWHKSRKKNAWKKFNQSLDLMKKLKGKTRRVMRLTLVAKREGNKKIDGLTNMSEENIREYAKLIRKAEPDFVHVKGFMSIGYARKRLPYKKQPWHHEIREFAKKLEKELNKKTKEKYQILAEEERSCVVVLGKSRINMKIKRA